MLIFMDGFEQLRDTVASGSPSPLLTVLNASGYTASGNITVDPARVQTSRCLTLVDTATLKRTFTSTQGKVVIGFAYKGGTRTDITNITNVGALQWDATTGKLKMANGTGTATVLLDTWYYYEIVIDKANQLLQVFVNNGKDIEVGLPASAQNLSTFECLWAGAAADNKGVDDLYFVDSATGRYVDRMGPIAITARLPTQDVDKEWSPSSGTDHWDLVNNMPPVDDQYVQSNTSGATDTYLSNVGLPQGAAILAVGITALNKKSDIDARQLGLVIGRKGQTQKEKVDTQLSTSPKYSYAVFETAPDNTAWTDESVTSVPFGVVVRP
ncbi:hypothetical protein [Cronobacter phage JC01]|uniref:Uncharacterized protein n=1 Tax=Cronobacter phage JC01 TaxID=2729575 RepID=A0A6M3YKD8_9CAUD|nr:hypothetical protein JT331_gp31 [Cronobacter phage JC01]QJI52250.1 hypothetical protein [Cronobacter phage JC01]